MSEYNWNQLIAEADVGVQSVPAGEYELQVGTAVVKPTSTGKDMIVCRYNVVAGPHIGRPIYNNFTLSPESSASMGFFFRQMKAHGLDPAFFAVNPSVQQVAENLVGRLVHVKIGIKPYNGEDRNSMDGFSPSQLPGGAAPAVPAPAPVSAFPPPLTAPPMAPPIAPPIAPPAFPVAAAPLVPPVAPAPLAPPVAPIAPPAPVARQFDPASGMELISGAWAWPAEASAGYAWNQVAMTWVAPAIAPVPAAPVAPAPLAPPMPTAPPAPSF